MSSGPQNWNDYQTYINNVPNSNKPLTQDSHDVLRNMINSNNISVSEYTHIEYKFVVSNTDTALLLGNDNNDYTFPIGTYNFIKITYTNGNIYYYILEEETNHSKIVYYYGEPMYM